MYLPKPLPQPGAKCKECDFEGKNASGLNAHIRLSHKKVTKANPAKSPTVDKNNSISVEEFTEKFEMEESLETSRQTAGNTDKEKEISSYVDQVKEISSPHSLATPMPESGSGLEVDDSLDSRSDKSTNHVEPSETNPAILLEEGHNSLSTPLSKAIQNENVIKSPVKDKGSKQKKQESKLKNKSYSCRHCDNKFKKVTELTSHMKACHTKTDDISSNGNAITVNSPFFATKHFFCHCSICGDGYDDYDQLSNHERDQHNHPCLVCGEGFMTQDDLVSHSDANHEHCYLCDVCAEEFRNMDELDGHRTAKHSEPGNTFRWILTVTVVRKAKLK